MADHPLTQWHQLVRERSAASLDARWVGPCKPGQKPGDVIMPNVGGMNINEMMKDPKIQEMMKRQK